MNNKPDISNESHQNQNNLGEFLKALRSEQGYTLRELEDLTGISNTYISNLENGKKDAPSMETLFKLSKVYIKTRPLAFIEMLEYSNLVSKKRYFNNERCTY